MVRRKYLITFLIFFLLHYNTFPYQVQSLPDGILIQVDDAAKELEARFDILRHVNISDLANESKSSKELLSKLLQLNFLFALPRNDKYTIEVLDRQYRAIEGSQLRNLLNSLSRYFPDKDDKTNNIVIEQVGTIRGVDIAKLSLDVFFKHGDDLIYELTRMTILIRFNDMIKLLKSKLSDGILKLYSSIENKEHLPYLIKNSNYGFNKLSSNLLQSFNRWYDPTKFYLKLTTTRDGIAYLSLSEALALAPSLRNQPSKYLTMIHKGKEEPFYLKNDKNNILDDADTIIFLGKRADGDSTWYENYTNEEPFFLTYDETSEGKRLNPVLSEPPFIEINSVEISKHIEQEKLYWYGSSIGESITTKSEGWYWSILDQIVNREFQYNEFVVPSENTGDSLKISLKANFIDTSNDQPFMRIVPRYRIDYLINKDTVQKSEFSSEYIKTFEITANRNKLAPGLNSIEIKSFPADTFRIGNMFIDYIELNGKVKPFAYNSSFSFQLDSLKSNSQINIPGFLSGNIIGIDLEKSFIYFPKSVQSDVVIGYGKAKPLPYSTIYLNGFAVNSKNPGWFIINYSDNIYTTRYFDESGSQIKDYYDSISTGSKLIILYNGETEISSNLKNYFSGIGSSVVGNHKSGNTWIAYIIKDSGVKKESLDHIAQLEFIEENKNGGVFTAQVNLSTGSRFSVQMNDEKYFEKAIVQSVKSSDLYNENNEADALLISYKDFIPAAERLAQHRKKYQGLEVRVVDVEDIYKEFNYGKKSVHPIRDFLKYAVNNWKKKPSYIVLIGDGSRDPRKLMKTSINTDYVPTYGYPVSDQWYSFLDGDLVSDIFLGRLPANNKQQAEAIVNKLIENDTIPTQPWMKNIFGLSGGITQSERDDWCNNQKAGWLSEFIGPILCGDTSVVCKVDALAVGQTNAREIRHIINEGTIWMIFFGHGAATVFDTDGWEVETLNNKGKYSVFSTLSCNTGDFAEPEIVARNESYINGIDKGFVAAFGSTGTTYLLVDIKIMSEMTQQFVGKNKRNLGEIFNSARLRLAVSDISERIMAYQFSLLGDPMMNIRIYDKPEIYIQKSDIGIKNLQGSEIITEKDSVAVLKSIIHNGGTFQDKTVELSIVRYYQLRADTFKLIFPTICLKDSFRVELPVFKLPGEHKVIIHIDPEGKLVDGDTLNNRIETTFYVFSDGFLSLDPLPFWNVDYTKPIFRLIQGNSTDSKNFKHEFAISEGKDTLSTITANKDNNNITFKESHIEWEPKVELDNGKSYWFRSRKITSEGEYSPWQWIPFTTTERVDSIVNWQQISREQFMENNSKNLLFLMGNDTNKVKIVREPLHYHSLSVAGIKDSIFSWARLTIRHDSVQVVNDRFVTGFNVLAIHPIRHSSGKDSLRYRRYNTWGSDTATRNLIRFLRDSIDNDYLLIATNNIAFRMPFLLPKTDEGCIDTLRKVLREFGSKLIDSVNALSSFAFFGLKGAKDSEINEMINNFSDTATIQGYADLYDTVGTMQTHKIGPAHRWIDLSLNGNYKSAGSTIKLKVTGYKKSDNSENLLMVLINPDRTNLDSISAIEYPYIKLNFDFKINDRNVEQYLSSINCKFIPTPEIFFSKDSSYIINDNLLRGEPIEAMFKLSNISKRIGCDSLYIEQAVVDGGGSIRQKQEYNIRNILPDSEVIIPITLNTTEIRSINYIELVADPEAKLNELYYFNNNLSKQFYLYEDTLKPQTLLYMNGREVENYMWVTIQPEVKIELWDNSRIPITDKSKIRVRINGKYQTENNTKDFQFIPVNDSSGLKAILAFIPDSLEESDDVKAPQGKGNSVFVFANDATGNADTLIRFVNVARTSVIVDLMNYPNPFKENLKIKFNYRAINSSGEAIVDIYNVIGEKVRSLSQKLTVGDNIISFDGFDSAGSRIPQGVYYYFVNVKDEFYVEPVSGKFVYIIN